MPPGRATVKKQVLITLFVSGLLIGPGEAARSPSKSDCTYFQQQAGEARDPLNRQFALSALGACPTNKKIRTTLERALYLEDPGNALAALKSLQFHLNHSAREPLLQLLFEGNPSRRAQVKIYEYLSKLTKPEDSERLLSIYRAGLYGSENPAKRNNELEILGKYGYDQQEHQLEIRIRVAALIGLGRLRARGEWKRILPFLNSPDSRVRKAALQSILLARYPARKTLEILQIMETLLAHKNLEVRGEAVEFLLQFPGRPALERLLVYYISESRRHPGKSYGLLRKSIARKLKIEKISARPAITLWSVRMYTAPTENGEIVSLLPVGTVVYIGKSSKLRYRPETGYEDWNWYNIQTGSNESGWIYGQKIYIPDFKPE